MASSDAAKGERTHGREARDGVRDTANRGIDGLLCDAKGLVYLSTVNFR